MQTDLERKILMKSALFLLILFFSLLTVPSWSDSLERNRSLRRELAELQARKNALLEESVRLKETKETLVTTRDLLSGKLEKPPVAHPFKNVLYRFETGTPRVIDNTQTKKRSVVHRWLKLKPGKTYLVEGMIRLEHSDQVKNVKFGGFVPVAGGKTQWPACEVGAGKFDWRKCSFSSRLPQGGNFCLIYGLEQGTGRVLFKDITVSETEEK